MASRLRPATIALSALLATLGALPASAAAATTTPSITLGPGTLSYTTPLTAQNFPNTTLTGLAQTVHAPLNPWAVTDARGSLLNGWNVTVSASQFSTGGGSPNTLPTGSLSLTTPPVPTTTLGNLSVPPVPVPTAAPIDGGSTQKIVTALLATGLGEWNFTPLNVAAGDLLLIVPAGAVAGTYTSTITTTLATGP
jgi:putative surface cell wall-binding protein